MSNTAILYTDLFEVKQEINLVQDVADSNNFYLWSVPTNRDVIEHFVQQANEYSTALYGDLRQDHNSFSLAKQYATKLAALRILDAMSVNWQASGMTATLGTVAINRLPALQAASEVLRNRLETDLLRLYQLLSQVTTVNSYVSESPYIETRGSAYWP